jgi:hypothetical protein
MVRSALACVALALAAGLAVLGSGACGDGVPPRDASSPPTPDAPSPPTPDAAAPAGAAPVPEEVREFVKPWQTVKPEWVRDASVIVVGRGSYIHGPHVDLDDGRFVTPILPRFEVQQVLKGTVRARQVILRFGSLTGLPYLVEGRTYLVFLTPDADDLAGLAKPGGVGAVGPGEAVLAVVDLAETEDEARARAVTATRSGEFGGFRFTPAWWAELRSAAKPDLEAEARLVAFLEHVVLRPGRRLADIRAYLGEPDVQHGPAEAKYYLNIEASTGGGDGQIHSELALRFHADGSLAGYEVEPRRHRRVGPGQYADDALGPEDLARLGLRHVVESFPEGKTGAP